MRCLSDLLFFVLPAKYKTVCMIRTIQLQKNPFRESIEIYLYNFVCGHKSSPAWAAHRQTTELGGARDL